jgi:hypothetical protein
MDLYQSRMLNNQPLGGGRNKIQLSKREQIVFGLIVTAIGLWLSYILLVRPLMLSREAQSWVETPCKVISAKVGSHASHGSKGHSSTTYSIDIIYEYAFNGKRYRTDSYDFISKSSSGYNGKKEVVDRYLAMKNPVCFVDPKDPTSAVLVRDVTFANAVGLVPLIFVAAGITVAIKARRAQKLEAENQKQTSGAEKIEK